MIVVDASVALCWFAREEHTSSANKLVASATRMIAPELLLAELGNVAWKKLRLGEMVLDQAEAAVTEIHRFVTEVVPLGPLMKDALDLARMLDHSLYDCLYLALAMQRQTNFVTLDQAFVRRVDASSLAGRTIHLTDLKLDSP